MVGIIRLLEQLELRDRFRAVPIGSADAVAARIPAADHHHVLAARPELAHARVARHALVLQWQELHREVHAVEIAPRDGQIPRLLGAAGKHHGIELGDDFIRRHGFRRPVGDPHSWARLADEDTGTERHPFGFHLVDPAVDQPLLHLEIGYPVAQKTADAVVFFEHRDVVPGARELLGASEPRRTGAHHRDLLSGLVLRRLRPYPAFLERLVDDRVLDRLDADRVVIDTQHARFLAWG